MIMPKYCIEPTHQQRGHHGGNDYESHFDNLHKNTNEQVIFPHVDSCVGMVLVMNDGTVIARHISCVDQHNNLSYDRAFEDLTHGINKGHVTKAIVFGDTDN